MIPQKSPLRASRTWIEPRAVTNGGREAFPGGFLWHRYSGVEVRVPPLTTEIIIRATRARDVLGDKGRRIRELTSVVQKRFRFPEGSVELYAERVQNRGLCAIAQCESVKYELARHTSVVSVSCAQHLDPPWDERTPDTRAMHTEQPTARES